MHDQSLTNVTPNPSDTRLLMQRSHFRLLALLAITSAGVAMLYDRWVVLRSFAYRLVDDDGAVLWLATSELAQGRFHEPRFYGQNYNSYLESILALPLYISGTPLWIALPSTTVFLALFPFALCVFWGLKHRAYCAALVAAAFPLVCSLRYSIYSSMPRGFVTGIPFVTCAALVAFSSQRISKSGFFWIALLSVVGCSLNQNAGLIALPAFVYSLFRLREYSRAEVLTFTAGTLLGLSIHGLAQLFYILNPDYIAHSSIRVRFSFRQLAAGIRHLTSFFGDFSPALFRSGWLSIGSLLAVSAGLYYRGKRTESLVLGLGLCACLLALGVPKVHEGSRLVDLPVGRMYLAFPILLTIGLVLFERQVAPNSKLQRIAFGCLVCGIIVSTASRWSSLNDDLRFNRFAPRKSVQALFVTDTQRLCAQLERLSDSSHAQMIAFEESRLGRVLNYGCPALSANIPPTIFPRAERRTWRLREEQSLLRSDILLHGFSKKNLDRLAPYAKSILVLQSAPPIVLLRMEPTHVLELFERIDISSRRLEGDAERSPRLIPIDERPLKEQPMNAPGPLRSEQLRIAAADAANLSKEGIFTETNVARAAQSLPPVLADATLDRIAASRLADMFAKQYFAHVSPEGTAPSDVIKGSGYEAILSGENLALGGFANDKALVKAWLDSPGHRENILKPHFSNLGVAVGQGDFQGRNVWIAVQTFATPFSLCPRPDIRMRAEIEKNETMIDSLRIQTESIRADLQALRESDAAAYDLAAREFNQVIDETNNLVRQTREMIENYNRQMSLARRCIERITESPDPG